MQVVSDVHVATEILSIIRTAKTYVVLVTPYVNVWERLVNEVRLAVGRGVSVMLYVRYETTGGVPAAKQVDNARALVAVGARVIAIRRLHTKVYLNEQSILTTSMNLVETSVLNSLELGICWNHAENPVLTSNILTYVYSLTEYAETLPVPSHVDDRPSANESKPRGASAPRAQQPAPRNAAQVRERAPAAVRQARVEAPDTSRIDTPRTKILRKNPPATDTGTQKPPSAFMKSFVASAVQSGIAALVGNEKQRETPEKRLRKRAPLVVAVETNGPSKDEGYCLRCKGIIHFDPARPLCGDCYTIWRRYGDPTYVEKACHGCGERHASSISRPLCYRCYRA